MIDRFLEEKTIVLDGFVGTSAGAMNAAVLAYGLTVGDRELARELLYKFWRTTSDYAAFSLLRPSFIDRIYGKGNMDYSLGYRMAEFFNMYLSPYFTNPMDYNPLRDILLQIIDFEVLSTCKSTKLYVCATNVRRGRVKVFGLDEISVDALLASACLPSLYKAVTIDGEDYWDGGYMGNPPIFPLIN